MKRLLWLIAPLTLLAGCYKDAQNKLERLHGVKWSGSYAISAINADLNLDDAVDIVSSFANTGAYPDEVMYVAYEETEVSKYGYELFQLSDQNASSSSSLTGAEQTAMINNGSAGVNRSFIFPFTMVGIPELDSIYFSKGNFSISFQNNYDHACTGSIVVLDMRKPGSQAKYDFTVAARGNYNASANLKDMILDLSKGGTGFNELRINVTLNYTNSGAGFNLSDNFSLNYDFNTMGFSRLYGYFGTFNLLSTLDSMELSIYNNGLKYGSFSFQDPRLKLKYSQDLGIPLQLQTNGLWGYKGGGTNAITGYSPNTSIPAVSKANLGSKVSDSVVLTHPSTNIQSVVGAQPTHILYDLDVVANPAGPGVRNFILAESQVKVVVSLELPFHGVAAKVQLSDTTDFNLDIGNADKAIDWINFRIAITNEMPLTLGFQAYFMDSAHVILDSLFEPFRYLATAATIDGSGNVISPSFDQYDVEFQKEKIQKIKSARKLMFRAFINTSEISGNQFPVKVTRNQHLKIKLGLHTKLSVDEEI
jgi:hypothetical protein